jgi:hypothetical protein
MLCGNSGVRPSNRGNYIYLVVDKIRRQLGQLIIVKVRPSVFDSDIATGDITSFA